ncbi:MAG: S49 family peptidase [Burkholderiales bacterium]|nr:S49 family peptidase [Burkholderiales bacterium]
MTPDFEPTQSPEDSRPATPSPAPEPGSAPAPMSSTTLHVSPDLSRLETVLAQVTGELMRERRIERRWRLFGRTAWFLLALATVWGLVTSQRGKASTPNGPHTALVEVRGEIASEGNTSAENIVSALRSAFEEKSAVAIVIRFNSPGGSPVQAGIVYDEIKRLKALHKKKIYAVCEEMCASGAYYMAVGADEIFVDKASIVGSIGVLMDGFGFTGAMDKLGIERRLITAGANKGMLDPFSPLKPEQRALAQQMIDEVHQQFIAIVREGRGARLHETSDTFSGLFWNGEDAVKQGLADRFGSLDSVARDVVKAEDVVDYTPTENVAERLAKRFGASIGAGAVRELETPVLRR